MKTPSTSTILHLAGKMKRATVPIVRRANRKIRLTSFVSFGVLFLILVAAAFYTASSASSVKSDSAALPLQPSLEQSHKRGQLNLFNASQVFSLLVPQAPPDETIATFAVVGGICTSTPQDAFVLGDEVCARIENAPLRTPTALRRFSWGDTRGVVRQGEDVVADPDSNIFQLPGSNTSIIDGETIDNRGTWSVGSNSTSDYSSRAVAYFKVSDPANIAADLSVYSSSTDSADPIEPGVNTSFFIWLSNKGPDTATNVHLTQATPPNMTFVGTTPDSGPTFNCTNDVGVTDCSIASLAGGTTATLRIEYSVSAGAPNGIISSVANISGDTNDPLPDNNSASARVEVRAAGAPAATCALGCPPDITASANTTQGAQSGAFVTFPGGNVEVSGDCGTINTNPASGSFFPVGTTAVSVTSSTGGGSCSFTVTVIDTAPPTITCAADQTAQATGTQTEVSVAVTPPTHTGTGVSVSGSRNDNLDVTDPYPVGVTTIQWIATDADGRTASCNQLITVTSADAPTIVCPTDKTFNTAAGCETTLTAGQIGAPTVTGSNTTVVGTRSDNLALTDPFPSGQTRITWTATDDSGRVVSCIQIITITGTGGDTQPPTLTIPPDLNVTTSTCSALLDDELGVATADDNCSNSVAISRTGVPTFSCPVPGDPGRQCESFIFPVGTTNVTYTATDASGNSTILVQHVTVHEGTPPTITAPNDVGPVFTGPGATACNTFVGDATLGSAVANDNCPGVTVARTGVPAGNLFPVGETIVTYTATDASGNTAVDTQKVTVQDNTPPVINSVPAGGSTDAGSCTATIPDVATGTVATDNCGIFSKTQVPAAGTTVGLGTHTITVTVTDIHGNTSQADTTFTVNALQFTGSVWLGLKNSDAVGVKFDLLAEVFKNGSLVGSGQINDLPGGSSGFNNAILRTVNVALSSTGFCAGDILGVRLSVRVAASSSHVSGTARLWYNDAAANSRFATTVNAVPNSYYLQNLFVLGTSPGPGPKKTVDVLVNRNQGGNPFKPFGTWTKTF